MTDVERFSASKKLVRDSVESFLTERFAEFPSTEVRRAAEYAVLGGGHRWRPIITAAAGRIYRKDALEIVLPAACGLELAHAASLLLDDLPSMDNTAERRGKAATHKAFPGWAVDMAPVFLLNLAYKLCLDNPNVLHARNVKVALALNGAVEEMIAGQVRDLEQNFGDGDEASLLQCYQMKSGALFAAAAVAGGILCGANEKEAKALAAVGLNLGISYQLFDDLTDVIAGVQEAGKQSVTDTNEITSIDLYGLEGVREKCLLYRERALEHLKHSGPNADWFRYLIGEVSYTAAPKI